MTPIIDHRLAEEQFILLHISLAQTRGPKKNHVICGGGGKWLRRPGPHPFCRRKDSSFTNLSGSLVTVVYHVFSVSESRYCAAAPVWGVLSS